MAPELINVDKNLQNVSYTTSVDIWSFGCLIFEALTGDVPYRREEIRSFDLLEHIKSGKRPTLVILTFF